jgi:peroxiredoxin
MNTLFRWTRHALITSILITGIGLMLITGVSCSDTRPADSSQKRTSQSAPDFSLKDLSGKIFQLSRYQGKPVLVIFVATWCPSCRSEIPHYKSIYNTYGNQGLEVAMVVIQESPKSLSRFASQNKLPFRVLSDQDGDAAGLYGIHGIPAMVLIGKDGKILSRDYMEIDPLLEMVVSKK